MAGKGGLVAGGSELEVVRRRLESSKGKSSQCRGCMRSKPCKGADEQACAQLSALEGQFASLLRTPQEPFLVVQLHDSSLQ